jgi:hypothetical protein
VPAAEDENEKEIFDCRENVVDDEIGDLVMCTEKDRRRLAEQHEAEEQREIP